MKQRGTALAVTGLTALGVMLGAATPTQAAAAPPRNNSNTEDVLLVHGIDWKGTASYDCKSTWKNAKRELSDRRWKGKVRSVAFYKKDKNCDLRIASGNVNTKIKDLGKALAKKIDSEYTSKGKSVDLVGHSMGGLIIRAAITGVAKADSGFPSKLYVEDVVTLGAPHDGTGSGAFCFWATQCTDMVKGSNFIEWLRKNPQSSHGTDWTAIASDKDEAVGEDTATGGGVKHWVRYKNLPGDGDHSKLRTVRSGTHKLTYRNLPNAQKSTNTGEAPLDWMVRGLYWQKLR
ncbi:lipase family alpha/beta hydrolase [Streptomyces liliifuscus]|uniref:DUF676 domain-containing protein n=1 Tax=Streptomyces liliifuscus TaxID=2797636 RepID=A0A7T7HZF8_9ACTN|nr:hypothetical protein [Streptomyces liliifuscus]QQM38215.1 hypothetical protein JEQ17_01045 [Streptomyces liliifuscus]